MDNERDAIRKAHAISSTDFRKRYASLRHPTLVTVNGHVIGRWIPAAVLAAHVDQRNEDALRLGNAFDNAVYQAVEHGTGPLVEPRPFTPVPKPGKRGK